MSEDTSTSEQVIVLKTRLRKLAEKLCIVGEKLKAYEPEACEPIWEVEDSLLALANESGKDEAREVRFNARVSLREYLKKRQWRYNKHYETAKEEGFEEEQYAFKMVRDEVKDILKRIPEENAN